MASDGSIEASLLVVICDVNPIQPIFREKKTLLSQCVESIIAFCNSHLMLKTKNKLAVLGCHAKRTKFLYYDSNYENEYVRQHDGQYELFTQVEKSIKDNLQALIKTEAETLKQSKDIGACDSLLGGAIAMALCYIHRMEKELAAGEKMNSRILLITGSEDSTSQYMNYMNVFFTAQRQGVLLDVCSLDHEQSLLQQGCDITGGLFLKIPQIVALIQYLMWVFLPEPPLRTCLVLPPPVKVDYRAACFCHRQLIDVGFVCSVCLSIFCKFSPICTTCHTVFQFPGPLPMLAKKKKPKFP